MPGGDTLRQEQLRQRQRQTSAPTFYAEQRRQEYNVAELAQQQMEGMRQSYEAEAKQQLEQQAAEEEQKARQKFEEQLSVEREKALASGVPQETVAEWEKMQREQFEAYISEWRSQVRPQIQQMAAEYAQQRLAGETRLALLTTAGIGAFAVAPVTAAIGAATSIGVSQAVKGITEQQWLTPEEALATAALGAASAVVIGKIVEHVVAPKAQQWLTQRYIQKASKGGFSKALKQWEGELGFQKAAEAIEVPVEKWAGWRETLVMKLTGAKPYLATGEVSVPVTETVGPTGVVAVKPEGIPYTIMGWELAEAPRTSAVFITKVPSETTKVSLPLFFGLGESLVPFTAAEMEGKELSFQKPPQPQEKPPEEGLPPSIFEKSYSPPLAFEKKITEVNVRGPFAWRQWPTLKQLMEEGKLLPLVTQTQVTRMGIHPYMPFIAETSPYSAVASGAAAAGLTGLAAGLTFKPIQKVELKPSIKKQEIDRFAGPTEGVQMQNQLEDLQMQNQLEDSQMQNQLAIQAYEPQFPTLQRSTFEERPLEPFKPKKQKRKTKGGKTLIGWYRWDYPTETAKNVLEKVAGVKINGKKRKRRS